MARREVSRDTSGASIGIPITTSGRELIRLATTRRFPAGVVISPDDRYAFVSVVGTGSDPGTVEIIDLIVRATVATVEVGRGARGIDFWKMQVKQGAN